MRFAAIADIHGNCAALEAVLADIDRQGIEPGFVVNLGDCFSGPLEAGRTADLLVELGLPTVRGNHDRYLLEQVRAEMHASDAVAFDQLHEAHLQWLAALPFALVWRDDIYLCHATPYDDEQYWLEAVSPDGLVHTRPIGEIEALARNVTQAVILTGHTHLPRAVRLGDGRLIVNPGSVGCPAYESDEPHPHRVQTGTPFASYAIIEGQASEWNVTFRLVPYDHGAMAQLAREKGRDDWACGLASGWIWD